MPPTKEDSIALAAILLTVGGGWVGTAIIVSTQDAKVFAYHTAYWTLVGVVLVVLVLALIYFRRVATAAAPPRFTKVKYLFIGLKDAPSFVFPIILFFVGFPVVTFPSNAMLALNQWFDRSKAVDTAYLIHRKVTTTGKHAGEQYAYFVLSPKLTPSVRNEQNARVPDRLTYERIVPLRSSVVMKMHPGAFGFPWTTEQPTWRTSD